MISDPVDEEEITAAAALDDDDDDDRDMSTFQDPIHLTVELQMISIRWIRRNRGTVTLTTITIPRRSTFYKKPGSI
jgi:hypothetical protein